MDVPAHVLTHRVPDRTMLVLDQPSVGESIVREDLRSRLHVVADELMQGLAVRTRADLCRDLIRVTVLDADHGRPASRARSRQILPRGLRHVLPLAAHERLIDLGWTLEHTSRSVGLERLPETVSEVGRATRLTSSPHSPGSRLRPKKRIKETSRRRDEENEDFRRMFPVDTDRERKSRRRRWLFKLMTVSMRPLRDAYELLGMEFLEEASTRRATGTAARRASSMQARSRTPCSSLPLAAFPRAAIRSVGRSHIGLTR